MCQVCLHDLDTNLPASVAERLRGAGGEQDKLDQVPQTAANREYYFNRMLGDGSGGGAGSAGGGAQQLLVGGGGGALGALAAAAGGGAGGGGKAKRKEGATTAQLLRMAKARQQSPYYRRNKTKVCTFWLCGRCDRVLRSDCPYRPCNGDFDFPELDRAPELKAKVAGWLRDEGCVAVMTRDDDEAKEARKAISGRIGGNIEGDIKKRYYGQGDEHAEHLVRRAEERAGSEPPLVPPQDATITTLFVGGVAPEVTEGDLRETFGAHGEIDSVRVVQDKRCAFVTFKRREGAEDAAKELHNLLVINGCALRLQWGRPKAPAAAPATAQWMPPPPGMPYMPPPPGVPPAAAMPGAAYMPPPPGVPPPAAMAAAAAGQWVLPPPTTAPPPGAVAAGVGLTLPPPVGPPPAAAYPSMDPSAVGAAPITRAPQAQAVEK